MAHQHRGSRSEGRPKAKNRGKLILAPCGTGKSTWIERLTDADQHRLWLDGDVLLAQHSIANQNRFWYAEGFQKEREAISNLFDYFLGLGHNILYSGNPLKMKCDLLVIPSRETRKERLRLRDACAGWTPSSDRFEQEELAYDQARTKYPALHCDLPPPEILGVSLTYLNK